MVKQLDHCIVFENWRVSYCAGTRGRAMIDSNLAEFKSVLNSALESVNSIEDGIEAAFSDLRETEIRIRRARSLCFPSGYFADVAWDILLELDRAERRQQTFSVSDVGLDAGIPLSTLLRYVAKLESDGFLVKSQDPHDGRRVYVALTELGRKSLDKVFELGSGSRILRLDVPDRTNVEATTAFMHA
jgi:DNA-binding MarR family transcriptional regulator